MTATCDVRRLLLAAPALAFAAVSAAASTRAQSWVRATGPGTGDSGPRLSAIALREVLSSDAKTPYNHPTDLGRNAPTVTVSNEPTNPANWSAARRSGQVNNSATGSVAKRPPSCPSLGTFTPTARTAVRSTRGASPPLWRR